MLLSFFFFSFLFFVSIFHFPWQFTLLLQRYCWMYFQLYLFLWTPHCRKKTLLISGKNSKTPNIVIFLKETRKSFKKWLLNLWWFSDKTIMEIGNVTKAATFKNFLHQSYKNTNTFSVTMLFNCFHEANINRWFLRVTQNKNCVFSVKLTDWTKQLSSFRSLGSSL